MPITEHNETLDTEKDMADHEHQTQSNLTKDPKARSNSKSDEKSRANTPSRGKNTNAKSSIADQYAAIKMAEHEYQDRSSKSDDTNTTGQRDGSRERSSLYSTDSEDETEHEKFVIEIAEVIRHSRISSRAVPDDKDGGP